MTALFRELTHAWRHARRSPAASTAAVATLALGIGATTLLYSLLYGVLQRPLPYADPEALVQITSARGASGPPGGLSLEEFRDWQDESRSYEAVALFAADQVSVLLPNDTARPLPGAVVSGGFFDLLGMRMRLGRGLTPGDDAAPHVVISESMWRTRLNADPAVLDRTLVIAGAPFTIVGVADRALALPGRGTDLWLPVEFRRLTAPRSWNMRGFRAFSVVARLKPGVTAAAAREEAERIAAGWRARHPRFNADVSVTVTGLRERLYGEAGAGLWLLFACVGGVMIIATMNVAGLLVARDAERRYDTAVRRALGATPARLWRQSIVEAGATAAAGALAGLGLAGLALAGIRARPPAGLPRLEAVALDGPILAMTVAVTAGVTILLGMILGRRAARMPASAVLQYARGQAGAGRRLQQSLVVCQVAMSFALVVASLLLTSGLRQLLGAGTGLPDGRVIALTVAGAGRPFLDRLLPELAALPGVEATGVTSALPPHLSQMQTTIAPPAGSAASDAVPVDIVAVSPGTMDALGLRLREGRFISEADLSSAAAAFVISARAAERLYGAASPIGRALPFGPSAPDARAPIVVGVVDDVQYRGLGAAPEGTIYMPYTRRTFDVMHLVVRSASGGAETAATVRRLAARVDPNQAVADARTLDALVHEASSTPRVRARIVGVLTGLALLLAALGLHGVLAATIAARKQEFAVRAALGAGPGALRAHVIFDGMRMVVIGLALGLAPAYILSRALTAALSGAAPAGAAAYTLGALLIVAVGLTATWWPAARAAAGSPARALQGR